MRLALAYGNIPFEDDRIPFGQFAAARPSLPLGQVPVMLVNGETYFQSIALARYAAKLSGLYPRDPEDALRVDMIMDSITDIVNEMTHIAWFEPRPDVKAQKQIQVEKDTHRMCAALDQMVLGEFFMGAAITLADVHIYDHIENWLKPYCPGFELAVYPNLERVFINVQREPVIAEYLRHHKSVPGP